MMKAVAKHLYAQRQYTLPIRQIVWNVQFRNTMPIVKTAMPVERKSMCILMPVMIHPTQFAVKRSTLFTQNPVMTAEGFSIATVIAAVKMEEPVSFIGGIVMIVAKRD